jgi:hypothetical protein
VTTSDREGAVITEELPAAELHQWKKVSPAARRVGVVSCISAAAARAGDRRFRLLSALRAHTNAL